MGGSYGEMAWQRSLRYGMAEIPSTIKSHDLISAVHAKTMRVSYTSYSCSSCAVLTLSFASASLWPLAARPCQCEPCVAIHALSVVGCAWRRKGGDDVAAHHDDG